MDNRPIRISAAWLLPVTAPPIRGGALLVDARGRIAAVGPDHATPQPEDAERIDLGEAALLPGLINVHAHPELAAFRGLLDDLPFHEWIPSLNRLKRDAALTAEDYDVAARWTCVEALAAGITTIAATEDSGAALAALREAGMRGVVYREVFGPAPEQADDAIAKLRRKVEDMRARETDLVRVGVSPHAPYTVSDRLYRMTAEYARAEGLLLATHAAEADAERRLVTRGEGPFAEGLRKRGIATPPRARSTIALLRETGVLDTQPLVIHCVTVDDDDIRTLADHGASVAHCPVANARLGHGSAPVAEMLDAGITVAIGTDSVASNNRLDLLEEARIAQVVQRGRLRSHDALPAERLLRMITIDAARALGLDARIGSLEVGKDADLCAVSFAGTHVQPVQDPAVALFHQARGADVVLAMVRGRILFDARKRPAEEIAALAARMRDLAERLAAVRYGAPAT